jgi:hypothetical protein
MKLGFVSDSLGRLSREAMLDVAVGHGLQGVEMRRRSSDMPLVRLHNCGRCRFGPRTLRPTGRLALDPPASGLFT